MEEVAFDSIFAFRYSTRPNTPAASFPNQLPEEVKARRLHMLFELQDQISLAKNQTLVGKEVEVLVDTADAKVKEGDLFSGRNRENKLVHFKGQGIMEGEFVRVRIEEALAHYVKGLLTP